MTDITDLTQYNQQLTTCSGYVVVYFYATWYSGCDGLSAALTKFQSDNPQITLLKVNAEQARDVANDNKINILPTIKLIKNSAEVIKLQGNSVSHLRLIQKIISGVNTNNTANQTARLNMLKAQLQNKK